MGKALWESMGGNFNFFKIIIRYKIYFRQGVLQGRVGKSIELIREVRKIFTRFFTFSSMTIIVVKIIFCGSVKVTNITQ